MVNAKREWSSTARKFLQPPDLIADLALAQAFGNANCRLTDLQLSGNEIGDDAVVSLCAAIEAGASENGSLRTLNLSETYCIDTEQSCLALASRVSTHS